MKMLGGAGIPFILRIFSPSTTYSFQTTFYPFKVHGCGPFHELVLSLPLLTHLVIFTVILVVWWLTKSDCLCTYRYFIFLHNSTVRSYPNSLFSRTEDTRTLFSFSSGHPTGFRRENFASYHSFLKNSKSIRLIPRGRESSHTSALHHSM